MHNRIAARTAAAAAALGIGAVLTFTTPAAAAPEPTPGETALTALTEQTADDPAARPGVDALRSYHDFVAARDIADIRVYTPFAYAAPTFGCGSNGVITTTFAAATANGPSVNLSGKPGTLTFHATPRHSGIPQGSGLVVAWININNGRSGLDTLSDVTQFGTASLSRTVDSGPGTVLASMWGTVSYPGALCVMTPTVGLFSVPDLPPAPAPDAAVPPVPQAPAPQSAPAAPAQPAAPAPAPASS
ncbi:hypothetical protein [Nocardia carnea]|uniref:hypothetical protein n=1 Tax=Nocardia carnea TaxID=37328 RepID=UPI002454BBF2|nr:hypothetical protein [Nocardia carnea]